MDLIQKYTGNQKRYQEYLNGKGDFFFVQDAEDELTPMEYPLFETMLAFKEIYNINIDNIVPSTYGAYITIHGNKGSLFVSTYQEYIRKLYDSIDYKIIGVDEYDKWGNNIKETYQKDHPTLFKNTCERSYIYKIVDAFVYKSPMIHISEFTGNHPYPFAPVCCLETWEDKSTTDIEVLHKRTKDYFENEIMLLNCKNKINKLEREIERLDETIHNMRSNIQNDFKNQLNILKEDIREDEFVIFKNKIEIVTMSFVVLCLLLKTFVL